MFDEYESGEKSQLNFYKLDKTKPYKTIYAQSSKYKKYKVFLTFAVVFIACIVGLAVYGLIIKPDTFNETSAIMALLFFVSMGTAFLAIGIVYCIKHKKQKSAVKAIIANCTLTDGRITEYSCSENVMRDSDGVSHTSYTVDIEYTFYDKTFRQRWGSYSGTYNTDPQFYKGQYLMIAFNESDSLILTDFTLDKCDERNFLANEELRSSDDFDGLTGELLKVDLKRPVKDYEYSSVWLWAAIALFVFDVAYIIPITIFIAPQFITLETILTDLLVLFVIYIMPLTFIGVIIHLLKNYFKRAKRFKKIMRERPYFTYGKMFASEKTYRGGTDKAVVYCYIDKWGTRHTETVTSPVLNKKIQDENVEVIVAYTASGLSTVILDCTLYDEE